MSGLTSMFTSPSKEATKTATAMQGLTAQDLALAKQYANQASTNEQTAIANVGTNPYFAAADYLQPSHYALNPKDTVTFGATPPPGDMTGAVTGTPSPLAKASYAPPPQTRQTQPVAQSVPVAPTKNNPFGSGSQNTAALESLLLGGR